MVTFFFGISRVINGVKDTDGFRETFNISQQSGNGSCSEDVTESTLLVYIMIMILTVVIGDTL